jgi:tetratricopeptide (TPR) repeat protein
MKSWSLPVLVSVFIGSVPVVTEAESAGMSTAQSADAQRVSKEMATAGIPPVGTDIQKLNDMGYQAMYRERDLQKALKYFRWNLALFPNSADLYDSLAEGYLQAGQSAKAIELYEKALQLDPHIQTNAVGIVAELKSRKLTLADVQSKAREAYWAAVKNGPPGR